MDQLRQLEERLTRIAPRLDKGDSLRFAFLFVRSRLWAQYTVRSEGATVSIHTTPAGAGETTVLSDENVLGAVLDQQMTLDAAVKMGLLQFSDDPNDVVVELFGLSLGE